MKLTDADLAALQRANPDISVVGDAGSLLGIAPLARAHIVDEASLQMVIIAECRRRAATVPEYSNLIHIPNGERRDKATAGRLKAMGVQAGVYDLFLAVARRHEQTLWHGLWLELKYGENKPSQAQVAWAQRMTAQGYLCRVIWDDPDEALGLLAWYISSGKGS